MSADCLFCRIVAGEIPAKRVYEDELCLCFADINPQAPTHLLIIPKEHIASQAACGEAPCCAAGPPDGEGGSGCAGGGAGSWVSRCRSIRATDGGQTVEHLHLHLLGGRHMGWPPG